MSTNERRPAGAASETQQGSEVASIVQVPADSAPAFDRPDVADDVAQVLNLLRVAMWAAVVLAMAVAVALVGAAS